MATESPFSSHDNDSHLEVYQVGWLFIQQYYTFLSSRSDRVHCFYHSAGYSTHGQEGEKVPISFGNKEIDSQIASLNLNNCKVVVSNVDVQPSHNESIFIQVLGEIAKYTKQPQRFVQSFFLQKEGTNFSVLNDVFRYISPVPYTINRHTIESQVNLAPGSTNSTKNSTDQKLSQPLEPSYPISSVIDSTKPNPEVSKTSLGSKVTLPSSESLPLSSLGSTLETEKVTTISSELGSKDFANQNSATPINGFPTLEKNIASNSATSQASAKPSGTEGEKNITGLTPQAPPSLLENVNITKSSTKFSPLAPEFTPSYKKKLPLVAPANSPVPTVSDNTPSENTQSIQKLRDENKEAETSLNNITVESNSQTPQQSQDSVSSKTPAKPSWAKLFTGNTDKKTPQSNPTPTIPRPVQSSEKVNSTQVSDTTTNPEVPESSVLPVKIFGQDFLAKQTVVIKHSKELPNKNSIHKRFSIFGEICKVSTRKVIGYIEFTSIDSAQRALKNDKVTIDNVLYGVEACPDEPTSPTSKNHSSDNNRRHHNAESRQGDGSQKPHQRRNTNNSDRRSNESSTNESRGNSSSANHRRSNNNSSTRTQSRGNRPSQSGDKPSK